MKGKHKILVVGNHSKLLSNQLEKLEGSISDLEAKIASETDIYMKPIKDELVDYDEIMFSHLTKKEREAKVVNVRTEEKINRNSKCICGSGKKYKKCCLNDKN